MSIEMSLLEAPWTYLAIMKGKKGEYGALRDLDVGARAQLTPLIQVCRGQSDQATVAEMATALKDLRSGWAPERPVLLDGDWMHSEEGFWRALEAAHAYGYPAVPVTGLSRSDAYQVSVARAVRSWHEGVALRLGRDDFTGGDPIDGSLTKLMSELGVEPREVDVILDLRDMREAHLEADEIAAIGMVNQLPWVGEWRHLALAATGMPTGVSGFPRNDITPAKRLEWWLWQGVRSYGNRVPRIPTFADYGITHPDPVEDRADPKVLRVTAHLRYTTADDWLIVKAVTIDNGGIDQLPELFRALVNRREYEGPDFSSADRWIDQVSKGNVSPGNSTTWRRQGTVRHLTVVTRQISSQAAA